MTIEEIKEWRGRMEPYEANRLGDVCVEIIDTLLAEVERLKELNVDTINQRTTIQIQLYISTEALERIKSQPETGWVGAMECQEIARTALERIGK